MAKKITRAFLINAAKRGELFVRCEGIYTDDYAFDASRNFGKETEFRQVVLEEPHEYPEELGDDWDARSQHYRAHRQAQRERAEAVNGVLLQLDDFRTKSGFVSGNREEGSFAVHSNRSYAYVIRRQSK